MRDLLLNEKTKKIYVNQLKIYRDKKRWELFSKFIDKMYGFVYDKRIVLDDFSTIPFGFCR